MVRASLRLVLCLGSCALCSAAKRGASPHLPRNPSPPLLHDSILTTIGKSPLIRLRRLAPSGVDVYVKAEAFNPGGSVKDRLALGAIAWGEQTGALRRGQTVVEASSGNTGIGLALVCAATGHPFVCVMAESFSVERRKLMRLLGAKVVLTNPAHKGSGMVRKARALARRHGWFRPRQFESEANAWVHRETTGPEILDALASESKKPDAVVLAYGTGGTLKGVGDCVRARCPDAKIIVCEPDNAPLLYSGEPTPYDRRGEATAPHASWRPHLLQGWATDFVPKLVDDARAAGHVDAVRHVSGDEALATARALAAKEGLLTGPSGGGCVAAALAHARTLPRGSVVVAMLADTGERYLSTPLFGDIPADMTAEEKAIDASAPTAPPPPPSLPAVTAPAEAFVAATNRRHRVVVWSLEYCEFCWTVFKLLDAIGVPYHKVDIDSFEFAEGNRGNQYRAALANMTACNTFPQVFVGGEFQGGAADACIAWKKGELQGVLEKAGLKRGGRNAWKGYAGDPFEFLPKWMSQNPLRDR